jgi:hypothetical protein
MQAEERRRVFGCEGARTVVVPGWREIGAVFQLKVPSVDWEEVIAERRYSRSLGRELKRIVFWELVTLVCSAERCNLTYIFFQPKRLFHRLHSKLWFGGFAEWESHHPMQYAAE